MCPNEAAQAQGEAAPERVVPSGCSSPADPLIGESYDSGPMA